MITDQPELTHFSRLLRSTWSLWISLLILNSSLSSSGTTRIWWTLSRPTRSMLIIFSVYSHCATPWCRRTKMDGELKTFHSIIWRSNKTKMVLCAFVQIGIPGAESRRSGSRVGGQKFRLCIQASHAKYDHNRCERPKWGNYRKLILNQKKTRSLKALNVLMAFLTLGIWIAQHSGLQQYAKANVGDTSTQRWDNSL